MPLDIPLSRHIQGRFANDVARHLHPRGLAPPPVPHHVLAPLTIRNGRQWLTAALALSSAMAVGRLPSRTAQLSAGRAAQRPAGAADIAAAPPVAAIVPGAHAQGGIGYQAVPVAAESPTATATTLEHIANAATLRCFAQPQQCPRTLAAGVLAAATVVGSAVAGGVVGFALGRGTMPPPDVADLQAVSPTALPQTLYNLLPAEHRHRLLEIVRDCGTDAAACTGPALHALLDGLPAEVRHQIRATLGVAHRTAPHGPGGWPAGADAAALAPVLSWTDWAAALLGSVVSPAQACFQLDLEEIAQATLEAQAGVTRGAAREAAANHARFATLRGLFERDGHTVQPHPFNVTGISLDGHDTLSGCNLMVEFRGPGGAARTLMLMAHGDMTGTDEGSSGASDNGTGLAVLLALARRLGAAALPDGVRVQLLVTDLEELGMLGAKAYAAHCLAQGGCPDVALNLDMVGRGDGMTLSGSDRHHLYMDGDLPAQQPPPAAVSDAEAHLRRLLESAAAAVGLTVHASAGWVLQSDQIAFQREGIPALGMNLMDAADLPLERNLQQARAQLWAAHDAVDWSRFDEYLSNTLPSAQAPEMDAHLDALERALHTYQTLPLSRGLAHIHNRHDQLGQVDVPQAMTALAVLEATIDAWLQTPAATHPPARPHHAS